MKTTCSFVLVLAALLFAIQAHADSGSDDVLNVQSGLATYQVGTFQESFSWDVTTDTLSDFTLTYIGPLDVVWNATPTSIIFNLGGISEMSYSDNAGDGLQLSWQNLEFALLPVPGIGNNPDVFLACANHSLCPGEDVSRQSFTVAQTPEPTAIFLVLASVPFLLKYRDRRLRRRIDV